MFVQVPSLRHTHVVAFNTGDGSVNGSQWELHTVIHASRDARKALDTGRLNLTSDCFACSSASAHYSFQFS